MLVNNRYELLQMIGRGGMGIVYKAHDRLHDSLIALKQLRPDQQRHREFDSLALAREFRTLAGLRHPNIISVLDYGFDETPYFTMQFLESPQNLLDYLRDHPLDTRLGYLMQVLSALVYLHRHGILHRDLTPDNILVSGDQVRLLDFGLALSLDESDTESEPVGTLAYMAPELLQGGDYSVASDLYAIGILAYRVLTGQAPYAATTPQDLIQEIIFECPNLGAAPPAYVPFINKLTAKNPAERYQNAISALQELADLADLPLPLTHHQVQESFIGAARFVGRELEMAQLLDAYQRITEGHGQVILLGGESGVGKSRLLEEFRAHVLVKGAVVVQGQAVAEGGLPYQVWRDALPQLILNTKLDEPQASLLKRIVPHMDKLLGKSVSLPEAIHAEDMRQRLTQAIVQTLHVQAQPTVILLEDIQWAHEGMDVLKELQQSLHHTPVLIVCSYRADEMPDIPQVLPKAQALSVARLRREDILNLSTAMTGNHDPALGVQLYEESEGNTFFVVEAVRYLAQQVGNLEGISAGDLKPHLLTGGMRVLLQRRVESVPDWALPLLKLAAVAGRELDTRLLAQAMPAIEQNAWFSACEQLLVVYEDRWRFSHDKLREYLIDSLTPSEMRMLNRQVAMSIEAVHQNSQAYATVLMQHWLLAEDYERARDYAMLAIPQQLETGTFDEALRLIEIAWQELSNVLQAEHDYYLHLWRGRVLRNNADLSLAEEAHRQALMIAEALNTPHLLVEALIQNSVNGFQSGKFDESDIYLERALALSLEIGDEASIARCYNRLGMNQLSQGNTNNALPLLEMALILYKQEGDSLGIANTHKSLCNLYLREGNFSEAQHYAELDLAYRQRVGDQFGLANTLNMLGIICMNTKQFEQGEAYYLESIALCRQISFRYGESIAQTNLGMYALNHARYSEALSLFEDALAIKRQLSEPKGSILCLGGIALCHMRLQTDIDPFPFIWEAMQTAYEINARAHFTYLMPMLAQWEALRGNHKQALALLFFMLDHPATSSEAAQQGRNMLAYLRQQNAFTQAMEKTEEADAKILSIEHVYQHYVQYRI